MEIKPKIVNIILFLLLLTSILGSVTPGFELMGFHIYSFRIILIILSIYWAYKLAVKKGEIKKVFEGQLLKSLLITMITIMVYGVCLAFRSHDNILFVKEIFYWIIACMIVSNVYLFKESVTFKEAKKYIVSAIIFTFLLISAFSVYEFMSAKHIVFETSFVKKLLLDYPGREISDPYFTFINPNNLSFFLVIASALVIAFNGKDKFYQNLLLIGLTLFIALLTESKLTIISCLLLLIYVIVGKIKIVIRDYVPHIIILISAVGFIFIFFGISAPNLNQYDGKEVKAKIAEQDSMLKLKDSLRIVEETNSSTSIRKNLIRNSWEAMKESNYIGLGPGQFSWYLNSDQAKYDTNNIKDPHGFVFNLVANYGVFGFLIFFLFIIYWLKLIKNKMAFTYESLGHLLFIVIILLNSNAPSSFIQLPYFWMILSLYILLFELMPSRNQDKTS